MVVMIEQCYVLVLVILLLSVFRMLIIIVLFMVLANLKQLTY